MDYFDFDGESVFLGLMFGVAIGFAACTALVKWVRCENCCWTDKK